MRSWSSEKRRLPCQPCLTDKFNDRNAFSFNLNLIELNNLKLGRLKLILDDSVLWLILDDLRVIRISVLIMLIAFKFLKIVANYE